MGSSIRSYPGWVQTRAGCESFAHTTRRWTKTFCDDPDRVLVLVDLANAFNCVLRGAVLSAVRKHLPWMTPWADTCYGHNSNPGRQLADSQSEGGSTKRLPWAFPFCTLHLILEAPRVMESQHPGGIDFKAFFLDDGVIAGHAQAVRLFLASLEHFQPKNRAGSCAQENGSGPSMHYRPELRASRLLRDALGCPTATSSHPGVV